ncbi:iron-containing alcohol dehydrogenase [Polyangium sp. 6x1]|uniref:iron-containing alcohol dehydrogenase n=1 Tax=Polyangium sp. 6x1 TaxID=3042689 RepID=UPI0024832941|nr:iron-containing alcohol dehydrogenase [Polyangium sp. 6x1]MDI1447190.1 iron-containing alcohol dehydrogenase [Polyangium sp. 6x1]
MKFSFRTAPEIHFGAGTLGEAPAAVARLGTRCLLVSGKHSLERSGKLAAIEEGLRARGVSMARFCVDGEPDLAIADEGARIAREGRHDVVLAIGGGSVIDAAKAAAALATNEGSAIDYVEAVGAGRTIENAPLPLVAVPTTAGSGSEVTKNSVLRVPDLRVKRSIRSDLMVPRVALVDPSLIATAPKSVAASSGLDALTHLVEAYLSKGAQPMTDVLVVPGITLAYRALVALAEDRATDESHEAMALAALWGGIALANAGLGAVHGLVAPLGGLCGVPHGAGCGCLLPATFATNVAALRARAPGHPALARAHEVADLLLPPDAPDRSPERAADAFQGLRDKLDVPSLRSYGVSETDLASIIAGSRAGSMRSNPIELTDAELEGILARSLGAPLG